MYTLHAILGNQTALKSFSGEAVASIACNLMRADGWTVWLTDPNGELFDPISMNEFTALCGKARSETSVGTDRA